MTLPSKHAKINYLESKSNLTGISAIVSAICKYYPIDVLGVFAWMKGLA